MYIQYIPIGITIILNTDGSQHTPTVRVGPLLRVLAGVDIGFDADGCVNAVNKVVHTHYLLTQSQRQLLAHTYNSTNLTNRLDRLGYNM